MNESKSRELRQAAARIKDKFYPDAGDGMYRVVYKHLKKSFLLRKREGIA